MNQGSTEGDRDDVPDAQNRLQMRGHHVCKWTGEVARDNHIRIERLGLNRRREPRVTGHAAL
jgi:hypothetical protein